MTKPFDTRVKGDPSTFFAKEVNAWNKGAQIDRANEINNDVPRSNTNTQNSIMFVKNVSDKTIEQYHCMVIEDFIFNPVKKDEEEQKRTDIAFKAQTSFKVNIYDETNEKHRNARIVILQQPIAEGKMGEAMIVGSSQIRVNITNQKHTAFTLKSGKTILESSTGGEVGVIAKQSKDGEGWAFGMINDCQTKKQFKIIGLQENDVIHCHEFKDGVEGTIVYKVAMPYLIRRTKFDNLVDPSDPLRRYVYSDFNKRKAFLTVGTEEEEENQVIEPAYLKGQIIYAERCVNGGTEVKDQSDDPIEWLDDNQSARWWYEDEEAEEE